MPYAKWRQFRPYGLTGHILPLRVEQSKKSLKPGDHEVYVAMATKIWILPVFVFVLFA